MASFAPGNGWFPQGLSVAKKAPRRMVAGSGNVYAFPGVAHARPQVSGRPFQRRVRKTALIAYLVALVAGSVVWMGSLVVLVGAALSANVPWTTVAAIAASIHFLWTLLALVAGRRIARRLLAAPRDGYPALAGTRLLAE